MRDKIRWALDLFVLTLTITALWVYLIVITYTNDPIIPFYAS